MARDRIWALLPFVCSSCRHSRPVTPIIPTNFSRMASARASTPRSGNTRTMDNILSRAGGTPKKDPLAAFTFENLGDMVSNNSVPSMTDPSLFTTTRDQQPHRLHIYITKHNTHMTLTAAAPIPIKVAREDVWRPPPPNLPVLTYSTGRLGFRKAQRGTYDAAYQLTSYTLKRIQDKGLLPSIQAMEIVLRGFGPGREAVIKALLGQEGRLIRPKIVSVSDGTRLKFGGSRSPNPRRLG